MIYIIQVYYVHSFDVIKNVKHNSHERERERERERKREREREREREKTFYLISQIIMFFWSRLWILNRLIKVGNGKD